MCVENMTGLFAWLNLDGMGGFGSSSPGDAWTRHSISYQHNLRWKGDKKYLFTDEVNSTWADDRPRFFDETQAYTSILLTGPRSATIMYQQWAEPKGHNGTTFAIHVEIRPDANEQPPPSMKHDDDKETASTNIATHRGKNVYTRILLDHDGADLSLLSDLQPG